MERKNIFSFENCLQLKLKVSGPKERIYDCLTCISIISVEPRETTLTFSDFIEKVSPVESERARVVSLITTEITKIT